MEHYFLQNKFLPKRQKRQFSLDNSLKQPSLTSFCVVQKLSSCSKPSDKLSQSLNKKKNQSNFALIDGQLVLEPNKANALNKYFQLYHNKANPSNPYKITHLCPCVPVFRPLKQGSQPHTSKSITPKKTPQIISPNIQKTQSLLKNKSALRSSFVNSKFKSLNSESIAIKNKPGNVNEIIQISNKLATFKRIHTNKTTDLGYLIQPMQTKITPSTIAKNHNKSQNHDKITAFTKTLETLDLKREGAQDQGIMKALNINESFRNDPFDEDLDYYLSKKS